MEQDKAVHKLKKIVGKNLYKLAKKYDVTITTSKGTTNKGWTGNVCEKYLGLPKNSTQAPDFGSWELKCVPIRRKKNGNLRFKEQMQITMINEENVKNTSFKKSHLLSKLKIIVIVVYEDKGDKQHACVHSIHTIKLKDKLYEAVKADYKLIQRCLKNPKRGFSHLSGKMGKYISPRTKGKGHGSTSRAFYARKNFLEEFIDLSE